MNSNEIAHVVSEQIIGSKDVTEHPTVIVLMGLQYAGKSYLSDLIEKHNYAHFWATRVKEDYGIANPEMIEVAKDVIELVAGK